MKQGPGRPPPGAGKPGAGKPGKGKPGRPSPVSPERLSLTRKVEQLAKDTGIPRGWAQQVVEGKISLNEVLTRMARKDRVAQLERRHGMDRSLAAQVADGQAKLDEVLLLQRRNAHLAEHRERSILVEACADGQPLTLALHGLVRATGRVLSVEAYELVLEATPGAEPQRIHKLQVKLAGPAPAMQALQAAPEGLVAQEPILRPQDRAHLSDRYFFGLFDAGKRIRITTLEGDQVSGRIAWISRWEIGLDPAQKANEPRALVGVFRHALRAVEEA